MPNPNAQPQPDQGQSLYSSQNSSQSNGGSKKWILYLVIALVAVIVIVIIASSLLTGGTGIQSGTIGTTNGTPVYLSGSGILSAIGPYVNYTTSDLFDTSSPANISIIENMTPLAAGNVTEGWVTFASSQSASENASIQLYAMKTYNASKIAASLASSVSTGLVPPPQTEYGTYNGLSYTYEIYKNATVNFQVVSGYDSGYAVLTLLASNSNFTANQTALIAASANAVPVPS